MVAQKWFNTASTGTSGNGGLHNPTALLRKEDRIGDFKAYSCHGAGPRTLLRKED